MTLTYLASNYSDPSPAVREHRFDAVCRVAAAMMKRGEYVYSPIAHTHPIAIAGDLPKDWSYWEAFDRRMIAACDELAVLMLPGWEQSVGIAAEIKIAKELSKPVRYIEV